MTAPSRLWSDRNTATQCARELADANGAPVAVLMRDGWYAIEEDADALDDRASEDWCIVGCVAPAGAFVAG